jgi:hypothetical protein
MRGHGCRSSGELLELAEDAAERLEQFYDAEGDAGGWQQELDQLAQRLAQVCCRRTPSGGACGPLQQGLSLCRRTLRAVPALQAQQPRCMLHWPRPAPAK